MDKYIKIYLITKHLHWCDLRPWRWHLLPVKLCICLRDFTTMYHSSIYVIDSGGPSYILEANAFNGVTKFPLFYYNDYYLSTRLYPDNSKNKTKIKELRDIISNFYEKEKGCKYDFLAAFRHLPIVGKFLPAQSKTRWMCSEFVAAALGLPEPEQYRPYTLYLAIKDGNF